MVGAILVLMAGFVVTRALAQAPQQASATSAPTFETARELAGRGRLDQAMAQLDELAKQTPPPAGVERLRGAIFYQRNEFVDAIDAFTKAEAQDASDRESIEMHGVSLFRLGRIREALPYLEKARTPVQNANIDPNYVLALVLRGSRRSMTIRGTRLLRSSDLSLTRRGHICWRGGCFCGES